MKSSWWPWTKSELCVTLRGYINISGMVDRRLIESDFGSRPRQGRDFPIAMSIFGLIIAVQLIVIGYGLFRRAAVATVASEEITTAPVPASVPASVPVASTTPAVPAAEIQAPPSTVIEESQSTTDSAPAALIPPPSVVTQPAPELVPPVAPPASAPATPLPLPLQTASSSDGADAAPGFVGPAKTGAGDASQGTTTDLFSRLESLAPTFPMEDSILERLLVTGSELRQSGNMSGALQAYRQVETALPEHPRILSEIAATLGKMGLKDKSNAYWEKVEAQGDILAGKYALLAKRELHGEETTGVISGEITETTEIASDRIENVAEVATVAESPTNSDAIVAPDPAKIASTADVAASANPSLAPAGTMPYVEREMKIGEIEVKQEGDASQGQQVSLKIVIDADPATKPEGSDLQLLVRFFDQTTGDIVEPTTADISYLYPTEPYDWQVNGTETIIVNYKQPAISEQEKRVRGSRNYYGYTIELYYKDKLQEKVAMPEDLSTRQFSPILQNAPIFQPDSALFPTPESP